MKLIAVSGVPGTGKTTIAKRLSKKLNYYYLDANKLISKYKLSEGYDRKRKTKIIDVDKLNRKLIKEIKTLTKKSNKLFSSKNKINKNIKKFKGIIIDSHLSHYLPRKYVDFCIVTKCDIKELNKRLKNKGFNKNKIQENIQSEIFGICLNETKERKHKIILVDTTKGFNIDEIAKQLGG